MATEQAAGQAGEAGKPPNNLTAEAIDILHRFFEAELGFAAEVHNSDYERQSWILNQLLSALSMARRTLTAEQRAEAARGLASRIASDVLAALSGAGHCTPEEGYLKASYLVQGDIERALKAERHAGDAKMSEARAETAEAEVKRLTAENALLQREVALWYPSTNMISGTWSCASPPVGAHLEPEKQEVRRLLDANTAATEQLAGAVASLQRIEARRRRAGGCICLKSKYEQYSVTVIDPACPVHGENT